jgi:hypothetical protein
VRELEKRTWAVPISYPPRSASCAVAPRLRWPLLPQCLLGECYVYRINPKLGGVERAAGGLTEGMARRIAEMLNSREELA